ncbi:MULTISPECIES: DUF2017 domain-containing protein [unclassified Aeromicrobium]|uniref:DUF2017 domain-containing protein n=1 Tax=unclassified Aeromicrobium TaxID=2633570 RepID=UPI002097F0B0|nr:MULTISPECIES: DUF2017 domain-containing protein [unclassified Aeromicrobium]MCO7239955.1 DUF2017 domain-containing protein [Aeromicrobium sp. CnD17-E]MDR6120226.1 hypothetical protein [Aeromicrobium sp. SORGH_AS_0981]
MRPFKRRRRGGVVAVFEPDEAHVLANLAGQVVELLRDRNGASESDPDPLAVQLGMGGPSLPPEDPVLRRLLPDAYGDDAEESAEFRRFTERSLTSAKVENAERLIASLEAGGLDHEEEMDTVVEVELDPADVQAWLRSLTDIRLSIAVRLGIDSEDDQLALSESDDPAVSTMVDVYDWLGYVQETLVGALD